VLANERVTLALSMHELNQWEWHLPLKLKSITRSFNNTT